jgi:hypothetical protein
MGRTLLLQRVVMIWRETSSLVLQRCMRILVCFSIHTTSYFLILKSPPRLFRALTDMYPSLRKRWPRKPPSRLSIHNPRLSCHSRDHSDLHLLLEGSTDQNEE